MRCGGMMGVESSARMEKNENIASAFMSNPELRAVATEWMMRQVYEKFQQSPL